MVRSLRTGIAASGSCRCCGAVLFRSGYRCVGPDEIVVGSLFLVFAVVSVSTFGVGTVVLVPLLSSESESSVVGVVCGGVPLL